MPTDTKNTLKMDFSNHVLTPGVGKPTDHYSTGLAELREQPDMGDMGPKFKSTLTRSEDMSTGHDIPR
jgi:hypothetical protein